MPMIDVKLEKDIQSAAESAIKDNFSKTADADPDFVKALAASIAKAVAGPIVKMLTTEAQVAPGIPVATAGSPAAQSGATTAPGKLM